MSASEVLVVDTGPLLSFIMIAFQDELLVEAKEPPFDELIYPKNYRYKSGDQRRRQGLAHFVATRRGELVTSSGVVAEMHRLVRKKLPEPYLRSFWVHARKQFDDLDIREENVALRDLDEAVVQALALGPVDAGILELASRIKRGGKSVTVATIEWELQNEGAKRGLDVRHIDNLVGVSGD